MYPVLYDFSRGHKCTSNPETDMGNSKIPIHIAKIVACSHCTGPGQVQGINGFQYIVQKCSHWSDTGK